MKTMVLDVEPAAIAFLKAVVESYDNLATLRTQDPRHHLLKLWFDPAVEDEVSALIDSLAPRLGIRRLPDAN
jgi:hypothetical protein